MIEARHLDLDAGPQVSFSEPVSAPPAAGGGSGSPKDVVRERWQQFSEQKRGLDSIEKEIIESALEITGGIVARTARILSVPRTGLISRMATLEIDPEQFKD